MELPVRAVSEYDVRAADVGFVSKRRRDEVNDGYRSNSRNGANKRLTLGPPA